MEAGCAGSFSVVLTLTGNFCTALMAVITVLLSIYGSNWSFNRFYQIYSSALLTARCIMHHSGQCAQIDRRADLPHESCFFCTKRLHTLFPYGIGLSPKKSLPRCGRISLKTFVRVITNKQDPSYVKEF